MLLTEHTGRYIFAVAQDVSKSVYLWQAGDVAYTPHIISVKMQLEIALDNHLKEAFRFRFGFNKSSTPGYNIATCRPIAYLCVSPAVWPRNRVVTALEL
jgi:hypothetical protein